MPREFGVIEAAEDGRILAFHEKNPDAPTMPGDPDRVYASMGNYVFSTRTLLRCCTTMPPRPNSTHDFGRDILPKLAGKVRHVRLRFPDQPHPRRAGDAAALLARRRHHRRLLRSQHGSARRHARAESLQPPVAAAHHQLSRSARQIHLRSRRTAAARPSIRIVSGGCILSGGMVRNSVLGRGVQVHAGALVEDCVILDNCDIGRRAKVRRAILDKNVRVPADAQSATTTKQTRPEDGM